MDQAMSPKSLFMVCRQSKTPCWEGQAKLVLSDHQVDLDCVGATLARAVVVWRCNRVCA